MLLRYGTTLLFFMEVRNSFIYFYVYYYEIFFLVESQEYGAAELMLRDCIHDINELRNCADCYKYSNEKINNKWFCLPCRIPHQLVWAKQKGYPYWPAKVKKTTKAIDEVPCFTRFFR